MESDPRKALRPPGPAVSWDTGGSGGICGGLLTPAASAGSASEAPAAGSPEAGGFGVGGGFKPDVGTCPVVVRVALFVIDH